MAKLLVNGMKDESQRVGEALLRDTVCAVNLRLELRAMPGHSLFACSHNESEFQARF